MERPTDRDDDLELRATAPSLGGARALLAAVAVGTLVGLGAALQHHVDHRMAGEAYPLAHSLLRSVPWWMLWGLAAPLVARVVARVDARAPRPAAAVAAHAGWAAAFTAAHLVVYEAFTALVVRGDPVAALPRALGSDLAMIKVTLNVGTYAALAGGLVVAALVRRLHTRELQAARLRARAGELEASLSQARLDALRAQLQPHFLFNTLNAITVLLRKGAVADADRTLGRLGELLRAVLEADARAEAPLAEELALLERYLEIQRVRFGDRLVVRADVPADAARALVPRFVLQPLVENAVEHGVARARGAGTVEIVARRAGGVLEVTVRDDGPGPGAGAPNADGRGGVGVSNTRARLRQLYGADAGLRVSPGAAGGTEAVVTLPARERAPGVPNGAPDAAPSAA